MLYVNISATIPLTANTKNFPSSSIPRKHVAVAITLLCLMFIMNYVGTLNKSITYDEPAHFKYGMQVFNGNTSRFDDSKMPVSAFNAAMAKLRVAIQPNTIQWYSEIITTGRISTMLGSVFLGYLVFWWASKMYGSGAGLCSLILFIFSPSVQGHARWITTDLFSALGVTLALFTFWQWMNSPSLWRLLTFSVCLGAAQLMKFTSIHLYIIFFLIIGIRFLSQVVKTSEDNRLFIVKKGFLDAVWISFFLFTVSFAVINAGYLFNGTGTPLSGYEFKSNLFISLQDKLHWFSNMPLPLPQPFVEGLDWIRFNELSGSYRGQAYLLGELSSGVFSWYYPILFLFKIPIAVQIILLWSVLHYWRQHNSYQFMRNEIFILLPIAYLAFYFQFLFKAQVGVRILVVFIPLIHIFCASLFKNFSLKSVRFKIATGVLLAYLAVSFLSFYPHHTSYFNELVFNRKNSFKILGDSNLDWGQNEWYAKEYLQKNPRTHYNPSKPVAGHIIVSANFLTGIVFPQKYAWYQWIRENLEPIDHVAYSYLVYYVPPNDLREIKLIYE